MSVVCYTYQGVTTEGTKADGFVFASNVGTALSEATKRHGLKVEGKGWKAIKIWRSIGSRDDPPDLSYGDLDKEITALSNSPQQVVIPGGYDKPTALPVVVRPTLSLVGETSTRPTIRVVPPAGKPHIPAPVPPPKAIAIRPHSLFKIREA